LRGNILPLRNEDGSLYIFLIDDLIDNTPLAEAIEKAKSMPSVAITILKFILAVCAIISYSVLCFYTFELLYHPQYLSLIATYEYYTYGLAIPMAFIFGSVCLRITYRLA
jgi:hypothetical protein